MCNLKQQTVGSADCGLSRPFNYGHYAGSFPALFGADIMRGGANLKIFNFTNFVETIFTDAINITLNVHHYTKKIRTLNLRLEIDPRNMQKKFAPRDLGAIQ